MMITVLLFAQLQEEAGQAQIEMSLADMTINNLKGVLQEKYHLTNLDQAMIAVNEEYAMNGDKLKPGDVVAFIPPVSGG